MIIQFVNREEELNALENRYKSNASEFLVIYGRRRVGKTEIIKQFIDNKPHIYFLARHTNEKDQLKKISELIGVHFDDEILLQHPFDDWELVFKYLAKHINTRLVFVIDEFPYLCESNKAISSVFQYGWDEHLKGKNILLLLCGSSIGMMEKEVLTYKAPLYGRRTGQFFIKPLCFRDAIKFFPKYNLIDKFRAYSMLGGIPMYLNSFSPEKSVWENLMAAMFVKENILYDEPYFLLREELREPGNYLAILKSLAFGASKLNEISNKVGIESTTLYKYLDVLESLQFIKRRIPITEKHPNKSRMGAYTIADNFLRFWFRFIFPFKSEIEEGRHNEILEEKIKPFIDQHISFVFEDVSMEFLREINKTGKLPFKFSKIGSWWNRRGDEIDVVALNPDTREILFCECKWQNKKQGSDELNKLKEKAKLVNWHNDKRKEYYCLISKSGFKKDIGSEEVLLFDLNDFKEMF